VLGDSVEASRQIAAGVLSVVVSDRAAAWLALTLAEGSWDINSTRALSSPHVVLQREVIMKRALVAIASMAIMATAVGVEAAAATLGDILATAC
jgi:hypothetical protein